MVESVSIEVRCLDELLFKLPVPLLGCTQLFHQELTKRWGKHCQSCVFCQSTSQKLVTAQYGASTEEFCSDDCRSKYTMLFCHVRKRKTKDNHNVDGTVVGKCKLGFCSPPHQVAKCDSCGRKGKLKQSLSLIGKAKHFCDLNCLLQFCCLTVATQGEVVISALLDLAITFFFCSPP